MTTMTALEKGTTVHEAKLGLRTRAMLASISISLWGARKFDRKITKEVNDEHGATADAGRWNKHLFGGTKEAPAHAAVVNAASAARRVLYDNTLPWGEGGDGVRLLPTSNFMKLSGLLREQHELFDAAVLGLVDAYPALLEQARGRLNGMFREADYPAASELKRKFRFSTQFTPIPDGADFRVDLPAEAMAAIERDVAERVADATKLAMQDAWNRLYEVVARFRDRMADADKRPRQDLIEISRDVVGVLGRLNVTADPQLDAMLARVNRDLLLVDAAVLRENPDVRADAERKAAEIMASMSAVYGGAK